MCENRLKQWRCEETCGTERGLGSCPVNMNKSCFVLRFPSCLRSLLTDFRNCFVLNYVLVVFIKYMLNYTYFEFYKRDISQSMFEMFGVINVKKN